MNAGSYRPTRYEIRFLHQGPNSWGLECAERGVVGSSPIRIEVDESLVTQDQMAKIHEALGILENAFAAAHDGKETELKLAGVDIPRAEVQKLVRAAEEAKAAQAAAEAAKAAIEAESLRIEAAKAALEAESLRIEAENIVKRAEAEQLDADLATMRAAVAEAVPEKAA